MPNSISRAAVPSLVEVLKKMAFEWRSLDDQWRAIPIPDAGAEDSPEAKRKKRLADKHYEHPITDLFRLIEEAMGRKRETIQQLAWRMNTPIGAAPLTRTRRPRRLDPDLDGFLDDNHKPDLPDLRPLYRKLNECDVNGTTATILRRFEATNPGVLASFGFESAKGGAPTDAKKRKRRRTPAKAPAPLTSKETESMQLVGDHKGNFAAAIPGMTFLPGAFVFRGQNQLLSGKALQVLQALNEAQGKTLSLRALRDKVWTDAEIGDETIRSAIAKARRALRTAFNALNIEVPADPLPLVDRGTDNTAWRLDLP